MPIPTLRNPAQETGYPTQETVLMTPTQLRKAYPHLIIEEQVPEINVEERSIHRSQERTSKGFAGIQNLQHDFDEESEKAFSKDDA